MVFTLDAHVPNPEITNSRGVKPCNAQCNEEMGTMTDGSIPVYLSNFSHNYNSKGKNLRKEEKVESNPRV